MSFGPSVATRFGLRGPALWVTGLLTLGSTGPGLHVWVTGLLSLGYGPAHFGLRAAHFGLRACALWVTGLRTLGYGPRTLGYGFYAGISPKYSDTKPFMRPRPLARLY